MATVELTGYGKIAEQEIQALSQRYPSIKVDKYVIMPNHIHLLFVVENDPAGASPRPTITDVVCAYKSITTRKCNQIKAIGKLFQASFYDHIVRGQADYDDIYRYIDENPLRWELDELYTE